MPGSDPYAAMRLRDYRLFLSGGLLAGAGNQMCGVAVGWEIYQRTGSPLALGMVGLVQVVPILLFALPAGHLADRFDRRRIILLMQAAIVCALLTLAAISWTRAPVWVMYLCLFATSSARAFHWPARVALLPQIVPREALQNAVTWSSSGFQLSSVAGPTLGGLLIAWTGAPATVYLIAAGASLVFAGTVAFLRPPPVVRAPAPISVERMVAGVRFVWGTRELLAAMTLDMMAVLFGGATALLPVYAQDILNVGPDGFGWLRAAPALGAFAMALTLAHRAPIRRAGPVLLATVAGFGAATMAFGFSTSFPVAFASLVACGAFDNVSVVVRQTLLQLRTPDEMRGRVAAVNSVFISASNELGELESGVVAHFLGPVFSVVSGGLGTMLVVLAVAWRFPELRRLGALEDLQPRTDAEVRPPATTVAPEAAARPGPESASPPPP